METYICLYSMIHIFYQCVSPGLDVRSEDPKTHNLILPETTCKHGMQHKHTMTYEIYQRHIMRYIL